MQRAPAAWAPVPAPLRMSALDWSRVSGEPPALVTLPNGITVAGYASSLAWLAGASPWFAVASIVADELDGPTARRLGQESEFGSLLDWAVDIGLTTAIALHLGGMWIAIAPALIVGQTYLRMQGRAPPFGSARAALTMAALV